MAKLELSADVRIEVDRPPDEIARWLAEVPADLPGLLGGLPLILQVRELEPGRFFLEFGPIGYGRWSATPETEVLLETPGEHTLRLRSVPDTGDAAMDLELAVETTGPPTGLSGRLLVVPHAEVPKLVPRKALQRAIDATLARGLASGLRKAVDRMGD